MNYIELQRKKAVAFRDEVFKDPGGGVFRKSVREFVLKNPALNIWPGVREDAGSYFKRNKITFWDSGDTPTGHLLSSQVSCINHLFFVRQREDVATLMLKKIDKSVDKALRLETGFVEFEVIGQKNYLGEKSHTRGINSTSVDAVMLGQMMDGEKKIFFVEWKYVEQYLNKPSKLEGRSGKTRFNIYGKLLNQADCPIKAVDLKGLFFEPYYQLMRQTLLANEMVRAREYQATDYQHLHVIPNANTELRNVNTADGYLDGETLAATWKNVLKRPEKYMTIDPEEFISPASICGDTLSATTYLKKRYWT
jgi:hypothetical protein